MSNCSKYTSCTSGSMPIDVKTTTQKCSSNCAYSFNYGLSSLKVTNNGDYLLFDYDGTNDVTYNGNQYEIEEIRLYKSSLNQYNGKYVDAELIIHHVNNKGNNLLVCIPINNSNSNSDSKILFGEIIHLAPANEGGQSSINVANFTLNNIVPKAPYYVYNGSLPYYPCSGSYDIILFDSNYAINMSNDDMTTLSNIICSDNKKEVQKTDSKNFFYNSTGTTDVVDDDIYISCNQVDDMGNIIDTDAVQGSNLAEENKLNSSINLTEREKENMIIYAESIAGIIGGLVLAYGIYKALEWFKSDVSE